MANTLAATKNWASQGDKAMDAPASIAPEHAPLSIVAPKSMIQSIWEADSGHNDDPKHHHTAASTLLGAATSSLAKFKAAQETENLPDAANNDGAATKASSATSSSTLTTTPGTDTSSTTTPAPPSSSGKKRRRRTAAQIDRKFSCNFPGCPKAYGSEGSLTQHQRLKHRQQPPDSSGATANSQLGSFFLPLHRTPARSVASAAHRSASASASRTVSIRPASVEGVMSPLPFDMSAQGWADASAELLMGPAPSSLSEQLLSGGAAAANSHRQNLRSRSNSMPVSFSTPPSSSSLTKQSSAPSACTPRPHASRKSSRASCTPRGKNNSSAAAAAINHRRGKCRSKSETLSEVDHLFLTPFDARSDRSGSSAHEDALMPLSSTSSRNSYDWSSSLASDSPHDSDQAIDSDILSVLADCDSSEMDGDAVQFTMATTGPLSSSPYRSHTSFDGESEDQDMLPPGMDCFGIADAAPSVASPTGGLRINDLFRRAEMAGNAKHGVDLRSFEVNSEWARSGREDTMFLSTHLENVAISSPPPSLKLEHPHHGGSPSVSASGSSLLPNLEQFPSVSIESFAVKEVDDLVPPEPMDGCDAPPEKSEFFAENHSANWNSQRHEHHDASAASMSSSSTSSTSSSSAVVPKPETPLLWMKEFPNASVLTPLETQHAFADDVFADGPHEWKLQKGHAADKQARPSQGFTGMLLGEFLFDSAECGLEDTRMGSPLLCQQEEL